MYIAFGHKNKGQEREFPINTQIRFLLDLFGYECWIFSMPGYLSQGEKAISFIENLNELISDDNSKVYIGFGNGYNAKKGRKDIIEAIDKRNDVNWKLRSYSVDIPIPIQHNHSKMLFFFRWKGEHESQKLKVQYEKGLCSLSSRTMDDFIDSIDVKAIIVGSSNQSYNTFFLNRADKGEADILLIASCYKGELRRDNRSILHDILSYNQLDMHEALLLERNSELLERNSEFFDLNVLSQACYLINGYESDEEYFKTIFMNALNDEL